MAPMRVADDHRARFPTPTAVVEAATVAAIFSGAPSTAHALLTGADPLAAARAAGTLLQPHRRPGSLVAGALAHGAISLGWTTVLATVPPGHRVRWGAAGAVGVAVLDLLVIGRRYPEIRALPLAPQVADHVAFGVLAGWVLDRASRPAPISSARRPPA
jgi:hypothetical protein